MKFFPVLELIDRLCIARVKWERTKANKEELDWYENIWKDIPTSPELEDNVNRLTEIHNQIWNLEWQLKSGVEEQLSLEEIGRRAIKIRDYNNKRIALKNGTAVLLNDPVREIKQDHLSA
jgi:hypothetical protein